MASGWGQGAGLAVGISSAVGMGLGNLVGALLSGVVAVPGVLVGSGVGAIHGPWYKVKDVMGGGGGGGDQKKEEENEKIKAEVGAESDEESSQDVQAHLAIVEAARQMDEEQGTNEKANQDEEGAGAETKTAPQHTQTAQQPASKADKRPQGDDKGAKQPPSPPTAQAANDTPKTVPAGQ